MTRSSLVRSEILPVARLALPITLAQLGLMLIGVVEVAVLGRAAPEALGGASIGRSIGFVALSLGIGASSALEPLAAQALGAKEEQSAWRAFVATLVACALVSVPCSVLGIASTSLLPWIGVEPALTGPARAFLAGQAPGLTFAAFFLTAKNYLQAHGKTSASLAATIVANLVNVVACGVLALGDDALVRVGLPRAGLPALGALGAGIANTLSNLVLAAVTLAAAWRLRPPGPSVGAAVSREAIGKVLRIGAPVGLHMLAEIGVFSVVAVLAGRMGNVAISAHQIAITLASLTFMGALGISGATAVRVGLAVGEGRPPLGAGLAGILLGASFMVTCGAAFVAAPHALVGLFTTEPPVAELAGSLLVVAAAFQLFDGVQGVAAGALRGAGDVRFPFVANVAGHWLVGFPLALWLGFRAGLGPRGLWWGLLAGLAAVAGLLAYRFVAIAGRRIERL